MTSFRVPRRVDPLIAGTVGVILLAVLGGIGLFVLDRNGSAAAPVATSTIPAAGPIVPHSNVAPDVLFHRTQVAAARQTSERMLVEFFQPYYSQTPIEFQYMATTDHDAFETIGNVDGQLLRIRSTRDGVFAYHSNQMIGVKRNAGGFWVHFTAGADTWRKVNQIFSGGYQISHIAFRGPISSLQPRHLDHQTVVGIQGSLAHVNPKVKGTLWVSARTLLPVQYIVRKAGTMRLRMTFSQWGTAPKVHTPVNAVDRPYAPPALPTG